MTYIGHRNLSPDEIVWIVQYAPQFVEDYNDIDKGADEEELTITQLLRAVDLYDHIKTNTRRPI